MFRFEVCDLSQFLKEACDEHDVWEGYGHQGSKKNGE